MIEVGKKYKVHSEYIPYTALNGSIVHVSSRVNENSVYVEVISGPPIAMTVARKFPSGLPLFASELEEIEETEKE
jgi:hypothetical protein